MFDFQKLNVYNKAKQFHTKSKFLLKENKFDRYINDQLSRASFSIILNIAEGSGRFSKADRRNFFVIARSSAFECIAILDVLQDEQAISREIATEFQLLADELSRMLYTMIKNLNQ